MAAVEDSGSGSDELSQLRIYLERESGFDPLITHGIVEAIVTAETREEAEEIALIYLEGDEKALGLVRAYLNQGDASSKSTGEANVTTETHALHPGDNNPPGNFESYNQASTVGEVLAPPGFGSPIQQLPEYNNNSVAEDVSESTPRDEEDPVERTNNAKGRGKGKQRGKGKKIRTSDLDVLEKVPVPGRHVCECQATRHELIANCLSCGRIVCSQEGEGPCTFCGTIVSQDKDTRYKALLENVKGIKERRENVVEAAISEKERLVGYDKSSSKQTRVIDDQSDFFQIDSNIWLSAEEKAFLKQREKEMEEQNNDKKVYITFDLLGRKIVSSQGPDDSEELNLVELDKHGASGIPTNPSVDKEVKFKGKG